MKLKYKSIYGIMAACLTMSLVGCSSEELADVKPGTPSAEGDAATFTGVIADELDVLPEEGESTETRSTISAGDFAWNKGDKVSISDGTLNFTYVVAEGADGYNCTFNAKEGGNEFTTDGTATEEGTFRAFYPATAVTSWNGDKLTSMVYAQQVYSENLDNAEMGAYMAAKTETTNGGANAHFAFDHICSIIDINLANAALPSGAKIMGVAVKSNGGEPLAGKIYYDFGTKKIAVDAHDATDYSFSTQSDVVNVTGCWEADGTPSLVRLYVLPIKLTQGVTITIALDNGEFYSKSSTTAVGNDIESTSGVQDVTSGATALGVCKPYYKKYNFGAYNASSAKKGNWMACIPSNVWLHQLSMPGSHDAATYNLTANNLANQASYCQSKDITAQLESGVRAMDLRPCYMGLTTAPTAATLPLYHGMVNTGVTFAGAMDNIIDFLKEHPSETVFVMMNKEDGHNDNGLVAAAVGASTNSTDYSNVGGSYAWNKSISEYVDGTYTDGKHAGAQKNYFVSAPEANLRLSACRGKIVLLSRNPWGYPTNWVSSADQWFYRTGFGGYIRTWQDNTTFDANISAGSGTFGQPGGTIATCHVQDMYNLNNTSSKQTAVKNLLDASSANMGSADWYINFVSMAASITISNYITGRSDTYPKTYAKDMNEYTANLLGQDSDGNPKYKGKTGFLFMDFCGDDTYNGQKLIKAVLDQNFYYVFGGRTRYNANAGSGTATGTGVASDEYADKTQVYVKPQRF